MPKRRQYRNPPIKEAVCEFRFGPKQDWDPLLPGKLQQALGNAYTGQALEQRAVSIGLQTHEDRPADLKYGEGVVNIQLATDNGKRRVGVGRNVLSVHMLHPYQLPDEHGRTGWDAFVPRIEKALSAYWGLVQPDGVKRIGIRYINEILIPEEDVEIGDYIRDALPHGHEIPVNLEGFICRVEYAYVADNARLAVSQATLNAPEGHTQILLDLDVIWEFDELISQGDALAKAKDLRIREREAFEAFITNKSRDLFDAD